MQRRLIAYSIIQSVHNTEKLFLISLKQELRRVFIYRYL